MKVSATTTPPYWPQISSIGKCAYCPEQDAKKAATVAYDLMDAGRVDEEGVASDIAVKLVDRDFDEAMNIIRKFQQGDQATGSKMMSTLYLAMAERKLDPSPRQTWSPQYSRMTMTPTRKFNISKAKTAA